MIELLLIGIGTGNPEHLTLQALRALKSADLVLLPRKGEEKAELAELRRTICADVLGSQESVVEFDLPKRDASTPKYLDGVNAWHDAIAETWGRLIRNHFPRRAEDGDGRVADGRVALLIWGDPSLYDSSLRIAERLQSGGLPLSVTVVPGVTSLQVLTAAHGIPLNTLGGAVQITTGRRLREEGWPESADTVAVMLDGECSFQSLPPEGLHIWWGAYLGMEDELCLSGPLSDCGPEIVEARADARARHRWIMDIYLLRRERPRS